MGRVPLPGFDRDWTPLFPTRPTRDHAYRMAEQVVRSPAQDGQLSVRQAPDDTLGLVSDGEGELARIHNTGRTRRFFPSRARIPHAQGRHAAARTCDLYDRLCRETVERYRRKRLPPTRIETILPRQRLLAWCIGQRWIRIHPLEAVSASGSADNGKPEPRSDGGTIPAEGVKPSYRSGMMARWRCFGTAAGAEGGSRAARYAHRRWGLGVAGGIERSGSSSTLEDARAGKRAIVIPGRVLRFLLKLRTWHNCPLRSLFPREADPTGGDFVAEQTRGFIRRRTPVVCAHAREGCLSTAVLLLEPPKPWRRR